MECLCSGRQQERQELGMAIWFTTKCLLQVDIIFSSPKVRKIKDQRDEEMACQDLIVCGGLWFEPPSFLLQSLWS